jgi:hypothetical protein
VSRSLTVVDRVRRALLDEARSSPNLLADLAGLESYIAEAYHGRALIELLQNADDAGACRFAFLSLPGFCIAANDGREFTEGDLLALCRSAASSKARGSSIGYRGIGFKSVIGFAESVQLFSGDVVAEFSRDRTTQEIPSAARVPLIRIPHANPVPLSPDVQCHVDTLLSDGYVTVFVFAPVAATAAATELASFDPPALLFLNSIAHVRIEGPDGAEEIALTRTSETGEMDLIGLRDSSGARSWLVFRRASAAIAVPQLNGHITPLDAREAVAHAFLPTEEQTGFGFKVNGDFSTDPTRRTVILDERTGHVLADAGAAIADLLSDVLSDAGNVSDRSGLALALTPTIDPRTAGYRKHNLASELVVSLQRTSGTRFESVRLRPAWLNGADFQRLGRAEDKQILPPAWESDSLKSLLLFLGSREAALVEMLGAVAKTTLSTQGCAELVAQLVARVQTRQLAADAVLYDWPVWVRGAKPLSLTSLIEELKPLDHSFISAVEDCRTSRRDLQRFFTMLLGEKSSSLLVPQNTNFTHSGVDQSVGSPGPTSAPRSAGANNSVVSVSDIILKRWRSAEHHVLEFLNRRGYTLEDVSRQNVGYDLEGRAPDGQHVGIEVKSLDYIGQSFVLTSNEFAVASDKGDRYILALVYQDARSVSVALIPQPVANLEFTRQCRQWAWECTEYSFDGVSLPAE